MDRFEIGALRSHYGDLLTERQNEMLRLHFDEDMSYGEIAEMFLVSRQAVFDCITKGGASLENFEAKLKIANRNVKISEQLQSLENSIKSMDNAGSFANIAEIRRILEE